MKIKLSPQIYTIFYPCLIIELTCHTLTDCCATDSDISKTNVVTANKTNMPVILAPIPMKQVTCIISLSPVDDEELTSTTLSPIGESTTTPLTYYWVINLHACD